MQCLATLYPLVEYSVYLEVLHFDQITTLLPIQEANTRCQLTNLPRGKATLVFFLPGYQLQEREILMAWSVLPYSAHPGHHGRSPGHQGRPFSALSQKHIDK